MSRMLIRKPVIETPWLDSKEAAAYLRKDGKYGYQVMERLAKARQIKAGKNGHRWLFLKEDLDAYAYQEAAKTPR